MYFQIAIDGPSGVGKSTLASELSKELNCLYINTGLIFRGLSWYFLKYPNKEIKEGLNEITRFKNFVFNKNRWFFNNEEINLDELKKKEVTIKSSEIAKLPEVRRFALAIERSIAKNENVIMEGRDIGTHVFPSAILKIFLNASLETRAQRRFKELQSKNLLEYRDFESIKREIQDRDDKDRNRKIDPLKKAEDAIEIYSDGKTIAELVANIKAEFQRRISSAGS